MSERALLVVDIQNDFCPGGALPVPDGDKIIPVVNNLIHIFSGNKEPVFATRDWHPQETSHFNTHGGIWPPHCIQSTKGAEFNPNLKLPKNFILISKGTQPGENGYSAFTGEDKIHKKKLLENLLQVSVKKVFVVGLALDYCVKETAIAAKQYGFEVVVFENGTRAVNVKPNDGWLAKIEMLNTGIKIMNFTEFN